MIETLARRQDDEGNGEENGDVAALLVLDNNESSLVKMQSQFHRIESIKSTSLPLLLLLSRESDRALKSSRMWHHKARTV